MPTILQTAQGRVTGLWGSALIRGTDGKMRALKMGDLVHRGDVILTTQDGIVEIDPQKVSGVAAKAPGDDIDRVISGLENNDPTAATATAAIGGTGGGGELSPALRVDRVAESIGAGGGLLAATEAGRNAPFQTSNEVTAPQSGGGAPAAPTPTSGIVAGSSSIDAVEEGPSVDLGLAAPTGATAAALEIGRASCRERV